MKRILLGVSAALVAIGMAGMLGGCVAETADDDEAAVAQTASADTYVPALPKDPGGVKAAPPVDPTAPNAPAGVLPGTSDPGAQQGSDPEPSPWKPGNPPAAH